MSDESARPWKPSADPKPPPEGTPAHGGSRDAEPVHGEADPLVPPGAERTT